MTITFRQIAVAGGKRLIGMRQEMSFANNTTPKLWQRFLPRRKEIIDAVGSELYSLQIYSPEFFRNFDPAKIFEKWALMEVSDTANIPDEMEEFNLPGGTYAVFDYKGKASEAEPAFRYIFNEWLPASGYELDNRPHFEILGEKYKRDHPDSEEEIWIPVMERNK